MSRWRNFKECREETKTINKSASISESPVAASDSVFFPFRHFPSAPINASIESTLQRNMCELHDFSCFSVKKGVCVCVRGHVYLAVPNRCKSFDLYLGKQIGPEILAATLIHSKLLKNHLEKRPWTPAQQMHLHIHTINTAV